MTVTTRRSSRISSSKASFNEPAALDDVSTGSPSKSGIISRRSSGTLTPATSVSNVSHSLDGYHNEAQPSVSSALESIKSSQNSAPDMNTPSLTNQDRNVLSQASSLGYEIVDKVPSQRRAAASDIAIDLSSNSQSIPSQDLQSVEFLPTTPLCASPDDEDSSTGALDVRESSKSSPKTVGKKRALDMQEGSTFDVKDFALDSDDEDELIRRISAEATRKALENSPYNSNRKGKLKLGLGEDEESSFSDDESESEYKPGPSTKRRRISSVEDTAKRHSPENFTESALSSEESSEEEPLANAPPPGQEDQRWETAKQREKRLRREAREARIVSNARRTGRKRKVDKRTHYQKNKDELVRHHPELTDVWEKLRLAAKRSVEQAEQPPGLTIKLLPFQREGLHWLLKQEASEWKGGILADEMGMGKTIQVISLFLSDHKRPNLVVAPTVAILQWRNEIQKYTSGMKVMVWHGANRSSDVQELRSADVVLASYGVLESAFRKQVSGFKRKSEIIKEKSAIHAVNWQRVILDEAHNIKERATNTAKAAFELKSMYRWCLSGTPLQNRVGELYSMIRFLDGDPFSYYYCKKCPCKSLHWQFSDRRNCDKCGHTPMHHICFWNNDILKPIQRHGSMDGEGKDAFERLRLLLERMMLRRTKLERADDMGLPPRTVEVRRDMFNEEEEDLYESLYSDTTRKFSTYLDQGTVLNNYSNIFTLLTRMRQLACHPDLVLRSKTGINAKLLGNDMSSIHVCRICQEEAEDAIMSRCRHIFCRECVRQWIGDGDNPDGQLPECPYCHATLTIDLEADALDPPRSENRIGARQGILSHLDMDKWRSSTKIEALVEELTQLKSEDKTIKSLVFSQFVNFLDLIAFRLTRAGFNICRLEGNMSPEARNKTIEHFMNNPGVTVFLVSLKAGGVALNLTEASRVYLMDPWWNPSVEVQAMDRIHRLGQHRPIVVKRMVVENSIESRIIELQNKKSAMIEAAIGKDDSAMGRLRYVCIDIFILI